MSDFVERIERHANLVDDGEPDTVSKEEMLAGVRLLFLNGVPMKVATVWPKRTEGSKWSRFWRPAKRREIVGYRLGTAWFVEQDGTFWEYSQEKDAAGYNAASFGQLLKQHREEMAAL